MRELKLSFELFPPQTEEGLQKLILTCRNLAKFNPEYFSVTFGAAGSSQEKTVNTVKTLLYQKLITAPHLSCVGMTEERALAILQDYQLHGVQRLVVIRGDKNPQSPDPQDFGYANDLVKFIRKTTGNYFHISVAAYPEFHPQAINCEKDLFYFQQKMESGADAAITQFFFNSDAFFRFQESCHHKGMNVKLIPGILPIYNYNNLVRFANSCGAEIPLWLRKKLELFASDPDSFIEFGIEVVTKLCAGLLNAGVSALHFYTLNRADVVTRICANLGIQILPATCYL
jgi:methylenetetrahydrofolate reductase (NADPH)